MHSSVPATTVHDDGLRLERLEPLWIEMSTVRHRHHDGAEGLELEPLRAQEGLAVEERDDSFHEVAPVAHHQHEGGVARTAVVLPEVSATEPALKEIQDLSPFRVLVAAELRHELETNTCGGVPLDRDMKRAFAVDEASKICIQPFLLIVRTDRIVTFHAIYRTNGM